MIVVRVGVAVALLGATACAGRSTTPRVVALEIRHSRFTPSYVEVPRGATVRFVLDNDDPIDHELIIGDQALQDRHERGTEPYHNTRPGEVSAPAETRVETTMTFRAPGTLLFGCHLPGHWAYGMHGEIRIV